MSEIERDRRLDAAWSAASREEPPPALDAAIRAAARRAVDAAPGSRRNKHWWYPLAAAATVAVLAVGIVQLTPPEQVAPTIVADRATAPREAQKDVERRSAAVETTPASSPVATSATAPPAAPAPAAERPAKPAPGIAAGTLASERARVAAPKELKKQALEAKRELAPQDKLASATQEIAAANTAPAPPAVAAAPAAPSRSEPFPAAPVPESRRDAYQEEGRQAANAPAGAAAPQVQRSASGASAEPAQVQSRVEAAKVAHADEAKAKDASARSVEEWIKRIRDLKNEGRLDAAAKELAAFRAAYGERADALLPADLRAMKAPSPK
jgi:hypothetical protein